jgi:hypothetical protein
MIGLDWIVGVPLDGVQGQGDQLVQGPRVGRGAVGGDLGRDRRGAQCAGEEPPGGRRGAALGQHHIDDLAVLVNRPVQVRPPASDLDVGLVCEPPASGCMSAESGRLDELGSEPLHQR